MCWHLPWDQNGMALLVFALYLYWYFSYVRLPLVASERQGSIASLINDRFLLPSETHMINGTRVMLYGGTNWHCNLWSLICCRLKTNSFTDGQRLAGNFPHRSSPMKLPFGSNKGSEFLRSKWASLLQGAEVPQSTPKSLPKMITTSL